MADKAHVLTDEKLEEMEKRLSAIYSRAGKEIHQTADEYFSKFAAQDEKKRKLLEQGKITEEEYTKWRKGKVMYGKRFSEMKEQCAKQLLNVNKTAVAYINGELPEVYAINYNALESAVDGVGGYSFTLVDADTVRNLAVTDTSLLPYKKIDPAKDIPWNMKKINAETLQGILQGESMDKIAKRIMNVQEMNKTQAIRSARTIVTGAENKGRQDSYARAEADGIILQKEWISTNDGRTRHSHAMLDGAIVDQDKKFDNGLMFPGDPSGRPEEVYNCRCTLVAKVNGFKKAQVQKAMDAPKNKYGEEIAFDFGSASDEARKQIKSDISYLSDIYDTGLREVQYVKKAFMGGEAGNVDVTGSIMTLHKASITKHEFFHTLDMSSRSKKSFGGQLETNNEFWKEAKKLFSKYKKEAVHDIGMRISDYSTTNVDEFMSEAFSVYYGGKPADSFGVGIESPYVTEAVSIIDKHFKRKKK